MNFLEIIKNSINNLCAKYIERNLSDEMLPIFYVAGSQTLPAPLEQKEEEEMIKKLETDEREYARKTLVERNLRLVVYIAKKFENTGIDLDDLISVGTIGLIKAVNSFDGDKKIKLATYASRCIENEILMYLRKTQKSRQEYSLDEVLSIDSEGNEMILSDIIGSSEPLALTKLSEEEDIRNLYYALDRLSKREREIIIMRYGLFGVEPLTQKEVADKMGISQSYISRLEKRIIEKMRQDIEQLVKIA